MGYILRVIKKIIPRPVVKLLRPPYHLLLAFLAALFYRFPSRGMIVIGVTGTNGKTTVVELLHAVLKEAGFSVASASSLRFKINSEVEQNQLKMTMPGRFALQKFLRHSSDAGCSYAVLEVTSEGIHQFRNKFISFSVAVLTNVTPEHIESHGSFEKYIAEKLKFFEETARRHGVLIVNGDDPHASRFLAFHARKKYIYSHSSITAQEGATDRKKDISGLRFGNAGVNFSFDGTSFSSCLLGEFNALNIFAVLSVAEALSIPPEKTAEALKKLSGVPGRLEFVQREPFYVIADYAHTPDALQKVYETLRQSFLLPSGAKMHCVLGSTGGGRDKWKRPEMGKIADEMCDTVILTNEDPYDEPPFSIMNDIEKGFSPHRTSKKIIDRREAIHEALASAKPGDAVIITGKGAEPFIMGPENTKIPWDDRVAANEELQRLKH